MTGSAWCVGEGNCPKPGSAPQNRLMNAFSKTKLPEPTKICQKPLTQQIRQLFPREIRSKKRFDVAIGAVIESKMANSQRNYPAKKSEGTPSANPSRPAFPATDCPSFESHPCNWNSIRAAASSVPLMLRIQFDFLFCELERDLFYNVDAS